MVLAAATHCALRQTKYAECSFTYLNIIHNSFGIHNTGLNGVNYYELMSGHYSHYLAIAGQLQHVCKKKYFYIEMFFCKFLFYCCLWSTMVKYSM